MKSLVRVIVALFVLGMPTLAATSRAASPEEDVTSKGFVIMQKNCSRCHAITMDDSSPHEEAPPFRVVVTRYPPEDLAEALAEGIVSGHPDMPEFVFEPSEIEAIVAYLNTLAPAPTGAPSDE